MRCASKIRAPATGLRTDPFIDQVWQVYVLIFVLQPASAAFTPTFQATIPDVLPEEHDYTRALSLSRLAYDLESLLSPTLAAALLTLITFNWLFFGTVIGFLCSAALMVSVTIPQPSATRPGRGFYNDTTRGMRIYLATPRLRGHDRPISRYTRRKTGVPVVVEKAKSLREALAALPRRHSLHFDH